jgi:hypothetical protein
LWFAQGAPSRIHVGAAGQAIGVAGEAKCLSVWDTTRIKLNANQVAIHKERTMKKQQLNAILISGLLLLSTSAFSFSTTFEEGLNYRLGNGPVAVPQYSFNELTVSFDNSSYGDIGQWAHSGRIALVRYDYNRPVTVNFSQDVSDFSIWAFSGHGRVISRITAYDVFGSVVGEDSYQGELIDPALHPYSHQLFVTANGIRTVTLGGDLMNGGSGWYSSYDDLSATPSTAPIPEPETYAMMLGGLGLLGAVARRRKRK